MSSIMRRRRGLNSAIANSCLRDGLQHPHPLRQEPQNLDVRAAVAASFNPPMSQPAEPLVLVTHTPIKHLIIIIGENWSFDSVFATYQPKAGETVLNLLSQGIVFTPH